jgi:hypothetical protein
MNGHTDTRPQRFDPYAGIHKGLRALLADSLLALGRLDGDNERELHATIAQLVSTLAFCHAHAHHENHFIHPAIEVKSPGTSNAMAVDHALHEQAIVQLQQAAQKLPATPPAQRASKILDLYRRMALFMAHTLEHLHHEETSHNAALWASYTDAQIEELHDELVASIEPEQALFAMRWMLPAMNPAERASLVHKLRVTAPPPAVDAVLAAVRDVLDTKAWSRLAAIASASPQGVQPSQPAVADLAA